MWSSVTILVPVVIKGLGSVLKNLNSLFGLEKQTIPVLQRLLNQTPVT